MAEKFYITTAITYTSGKPHIGNTYEIILTDALARMKRMQGYDVFFMTGTDEHGQKVEQKAAEKGVSPKQFVDDIAAQIKDIWGAMNISYDKFIRTTDDYHERQVQKIFKKFYEQGDIYKGSYKGMYCTPCESFWTESQLVNGRCPDCGREVRPAEEEAYFFRMGRYADRLVKHIVTHPGFIQPVARKNEMMNNFLLADEFIGRSDEELLAAGVDTVALAGYMRLVTSAFLDAFPNRVLNVHPAVLPAFPGTHGARDAWNYGAKFSGCTVHVVDPVMDGGPIIVQATLPVRQEEDDEALLDRIHVFEHRIYVQALQWLAEGRLHLEGRRMLLSPADRPL